MKQSLAKFFALSLLLVSFSARALDTNFFPVMAWNSAPPDLAVLKKMRECGFTVAGFVAPKTLKLCRKAGLMGIVSDARSSSYDLAKVDPVVARRNLTSLIRETVGNPALFGYYLRDEPGAGLFDGLGVLSSIIHELAPGKWAYINLFPDYANAGQLGAPTYADYLEKFCATCHPTILSYDHYALMEDGTLGGQYWENLGQMRAVALSKAIPFWNIVQGMGFLPYREPNLADLRFQVYSTLAYGARGIAYFQYFPSGTLSFRNAAIDHFGHPTETWNHLQNVNLQIAALAPTLLQLTSDDVYHLGKIPAGCHGSTNNDLITSIDGGDFMAGDFTHRNGARYTMVVNKSMTRSASCIVHFRTAAKQVRFVSPFTGKLGDFAGEQCCLAPGQGVLLKVD